MRRRTGRLFLTMLLPLVLLLTGLAGNCLARPYPAGFDPAAVPPEVSASEGAAKTVALGAQTLPFSDDVEAGPGGWTATGLWHRVVSPQSIRVIDAIRQNYVQLPDAGYLPSAYSGSACWWFGEDATGTFIGPNYPTQSSNSGGTSASALSGTLVSPAIDLTNASQASLSFYTWWEIEGVDVHAFDMMYVEVSTDGGTNFTTVGTLNPIDDANTASHIAYSTNGVNVPGEWGKVYFNLTPYLGNEIKLRFRFNTVDHRYNGFRGWFIDDVKVTATAIPTLTLTSFEPGVASPGQLITLHGTGFQDAATIKIGGYNAESAVIFHDKILVYVPQLTSGTYQVVVQNPSGASASLSGLVISTATAPTISTVSPALLDCSSTAGGVLTVTGTDFVSGATVKLDNTALSGVVYVSSSELRANLPTSLSAGNHNITVTNPDGLSFTKFAALNVNGAAVILGSISSGTPAAGVASALVSYSGPVSGSVYTGANGSYEIDGLINGTYNLTVSKAGLTTATRAVTISACGTSTQNFTLTSSTGTLTGRVTATAGGAGISGATVTITGGSTTTTDANGYYSFSALAAGTYTVTAAKTGYVSASAPAAVLAGSSYTLNFPLNSTYLYGKVTTTAGAALSGVTVTITGGATRTTDASGNYSFANIAAGTYSVTASKTGYVSQTTTGAVVSAGTAKVVNFSLAVSQTLANLNGKVLYATTGQPAVGVTVTLTGGATRTTDATGAYSFAGIAAAPYSITFSKGGYLTQTVGPHWTVAGATTTIDHDLHLNCLSGRVVSATGTPLAAATVTVTGGAARTTDPAGYYTFWDLPTGTYSITAAKTGYASGTVSNVYMTGGTNKVFKLALGAPTTQLSGRVTAVTTGAGLAGATVTVSGGATATTDSNGNYSFSSIAAGSYTVTAAKTGYVSQTVTGVLVTAGTVKTQNFALNGTLLAGRVTIASGAGLAGATVAITGGATRTTDSNGYYSFANIAAGTYSVTVSKTGYLPKTVTGNVVSVGVAKIVNVTLYGTILTGRVTLSSGAGLPGATVAITGGTTSTTDANGYYTFANLAAGTYTVTASKTGYLSKTVTGAVVSVGVAKTVNFTLYGTILTGRVTVSSGAGLAGATVAITGGATRTTDANGYYSFANLAAGTYTVTVSKAGYLSKTVTGAVVSSGATTTVNFTLNSTVLTGRVTISSGAGLAGATVTITGGATRTTDANGYYTFTDIAAGTYSVTASKTGYAARTVSGAIVAAGTTKTVNLTLYTTVLTGRVISAGTGLAGATVTITGGATRTTDAGGYYTFNNIAAGTYSVTASKTGYIPQTTADVVVATAVAQTVNFTLNSTVLSGRVTIASGAGLAGVTITLTGGATRTTDANGYYSFTNIAAGSYSVSAAKAGYITQTSTGVAVVAGASKVVNFLLAPALYGNITGIISDAVTGSPILGATVSVGSGASATTNSLGVYTLSNVLAGSYTVTANKSGYVSGTRSVTVVPETTQTAPIALSPIISAGNGDYRIILSWGAAPLDVDSHLYVPNGSASPGHVYFASRGSSILFPFANLDLDDRNGYGPETITIVQNQPGVYQYWVYNWSGTPALGTSGATVKLYDANSELATFTVPTSATGLAWHVFDLNAQTGAITTVDTVQATLPTFSSAKTVSRNGVNYVAGTEPKD